FHWDSAYTPARLKELEGMLGYPVLACNVYQRGTKRHLFRPSAVFERGGLKVGVVGVASNIIQKNMPEEFSQGADFTDGVKEAGREAKKLRDAGADAVVLLSHLGYPQDLWLLGKVEGFDLCLSGHTHNRLERPERVNGAYIIQSGAMASSIGFIRLNVGDGAPELLEHEYVMLDKQVSQDRGMVFALRRDPILSQHRKWLDERVGRTGADLHRASSFYGTMDAFLLDAMREMTGLDIAFSNGWRFGGAVPRGHVRRRDLYRITPMDPEIRMADITGREMLKMLEENLESTFACDPLKQMGGYIKRSAGLKVYFKMENPPGQRVQKVFAGDEEVDPEKTYEVAYVTVQAVPERFGTNHRGTGVGAVEAMEAMLARGPWRPADTQGYIPV
ncbi:MAG TPA: 5'-nucleotidase C-terminal domain-containing protein, partial [Candidatus Limnocylindria bacterium]|nr:5'-nucleotidase C-terminal domain-containing protein [Candidatus Limnocylindria bacterium]